MHRHQNLDPSQSTRSPGRPELRAAVLDRLVELFASVARTDPRAIDPHQLLSAHGIDSLMITQLDQQLAVAFDN